MQNTVCVLHPRAPEEALLLRRMADTAGRDSLFTLIINKPSRQKAERLFCSPCVTIPITKNRDFVERIDHFQPLTGTVATQLVKILTHWLLTSGFVE